MTPALNVSSSSKSPTSQQIIQRDIAPPLAPSNRTVHLLHIGVQQPSQNGSVEERLQHVVEHQLLLRTPTTVRDQ